MRPRSLIDVGDEKSPVAPGVLRDTYERVRGTLDEVLVELEEMLPTSDDDSAPHRV
jgi:hypothetical protein